MPTLADLKYIAEVAPYLRQFEQPSLVGISQMQSGSTMGIATPRQQREAQTLRKAAQPVVNAVADPYYAMTPGVDQRRQDARRRILEKVAAVATDPMAATFAGVGAKMADNAALARSLEMKAAGVPDKEIWQATGWTHGFPDGKARFEIDDSAASYAENMPTFGRLKENKPLSDSFNHAELYENYPETARLTLGAVEGYASGSFDEAAGAINVNGLLPAKKYMNKKQFRTAQEGITGVTAHELQHAVQGQEGFAIGGNPSEFTKQAAAETARDALTYARELQRLRKQYPDADISALENKLTEEYQRLDMMDWLPSREARDLGRQPYVLFADKYPDNKGYQELTDLVKTYKLDQRATPLSARDAYTSLAGEVEARLTQRRMSLNAQQRRQRYPIDDMDVKPQDQIVRFK